MVAVIEEPTVANKEKRGGARPGAGRPKTSDRDDVVLKADRIVVARSRYLAELRNMTLAEYATEALRLLSDRDWAKEEKKKKEGGDPT